MLELSNVKKSYPEPGGGRLLVLDVPELRLAEGEQLVVRGRSGCGKSTLLHSIAGITTVDEGAISIDSIDIVGLPEAGRDRFRARKIGYVFQTFNLLPSFSALENVLLGMSFTGQRVDRSRAEELLQNVGLAQRMGHTPGQLSVGEQQRVAVARALANRPRLLLADEPTANVDPGNQDTIVELIRNTCQAENVALLMVTHADEVSQQFERVLQLEELNRVVAAS